MHPAASNKARHRKHFGPRSLARWVGRVSLGMPRGLLAEVAALFPSLLPSLVTRVGRRVFA
eukprot:4340880-Alexandrium_andersonii.AAC.1